MGSITRARMGPRIARNKTYAADSAPNCGSSPALTPSPAMTMENSPRAINAAPARKAPNGSTFARRAAHQPVRTLVRAVIKPKINGEQQNGRQGSGIDLQSKEQKEDGGKQIAQGRKQVVSTFCDGVGERDPDQECSNRRGYLQALCQPCHKQDQAKGSEQDHFIGLVSNKRTEASCHSAPQQTRPLPTVSSATSTEIIACVIPCPMSSTAIRGR